MHQHAHVQVEELVNMLQVEELVEMAQSYKDWQQCQQAGCVDIEEVVRKSAWAHCNTKLCNLDTSNLFYPSSILGVADKGID